MLRMYCTQSGTWRSIEQDAGRRLDAHPQENLRVDEWQLDRLTQLPDLLCQASNLRIIHLARVLLGHVVYQWIHLHGRASNADSSHYVEKPFCTDRIVHSPHTSRGRMRMMVRVVTSSATRVLGTSLSLSTFDLHPTTYRGPLLDLTMTAWVEKGERQATQQTGDPRL